MNSAPAQAYIILRNERIDPVVPEIRITEENITRITEDNKRRITE